LNGKQQLLVYADVSVFVENMSEAETWKLSYGLIKRLK
jgi:hypothetical protein